MSPLALALLAAGGTGLLGIAMLALFRRRREQEVRRRLRRTAVELSGDGAAEETAATEDIFRPTEGRSRAAWLWRFIEARYPLLSARRVLPRAGGVGIAGAGAAWFAMWFLKIPAGWWTIALVVLGGAGATWYALSWIHARLQAEFTRQFPEAIDQIVRLSGAGVPALEAISVVAEDARPPVEPILRDVCDGLLAGLDADTALRAVSARLRLAEFTLFAAVIRLQRRSGGGVSSAFSNLSRTLRDRRATALKAHSSTAQTRLTLLVLTMLPVVVLLAQKYVAPESVDVLFGTDDGTMLLRWGAGLIVAGILGARAIAARGER